MSWDLSVKRASIATALVAVAMSGSHANAGGKREQSLAATPVTAAAVGAFSSAASLDINELQTLGVTNLGDLSTGAVPGLMVQPGALNSSTANVTIRGLGNSSADQPGRDNGVGVIVDGISLPRSQGLNLELLDLESIEVLRGPQGALFGRNTAGGAIVVTSKKPSGELDYNQQFTYGKEYNEFRSISHVDFPEVFGVRAKISYNVNQHDGWVKNDNANDAPMRNDFWLRDNEGGRLALSWAGSDTFSADYAYEKQTLDSTQGYFQSGAERVDRSSASLYLPESTVETEAHTLTTLWQVTDNFAVKTISGFRDLEEQTFYNFDEAATLSIGDNQDQEQLSGEMQLIGNLFDGSLEFILGGSYLEEEIVYGQTRLGSNDPMGAPVLIPHTSPSPLTSFVLSDDYRTLAEVDIEALVLYAQFNYHVTEDLDLLFAVRSTEENRSSEVTIANRDIVEPTVRTAENDDDAHIDYQVGLNWAASDKLNLFVSYSTAYRSEGASLLASSSATQLYDAEEVASLEIGFDSSCWDDRLALSGSVFQATIKERQYDSLIAHNLAIDVFNSDKDIDYSGADFDVAATLAPGLVLSGTYQYLDFDDDELSDMGVVTILAPRHTGQVAFDYNLPKFEFGVVSLHLSMNSASHHYVSALANDAGSSRDIVNARIALSEIELEDDSGTLGLALWGRNINDREYLVNAVSVNGSVDGAGAPTTLRAFGEPRTYGVDLFYEF